MNKGSIRFKFSVTILITTAVALLISSVTMVVINLKDYRAQLELDLTTQARILAKAVTPALQFEDLQSAQSFLDLMVHRDNVLAAGIYTERGKLFTKYEINTAGGTIDKSIPDKNGIFLEGSELSVFERIIFNNEVIGYVLLKERYEFRQQLLESITVSVTGITIALLLAFALSLRLQKSITSPLSNLTDISRRVVESDDFSLRADANSEGEVLLLMNAFNELLERVEIGKKSLIETNNDLQEQIIEREAAQMALKKSEAEIRALNQNLEKRVNARTQQLENANKELEAFSYSVSHDLRTPLRAMDGFSQALLEDYADVLDSTGKDYLHRVRSAAQRMGTLIDDILKLSRVTRADTNITNVNLSSIAEMICEELKEIDPRRNIQFKITSGLEADCDLHLIKVALSNLLQNAWKYSSKVEHAVIEFGLRSIADKPVYFVKDNGIGFDMKYADKLFGAFQRLHDAQEFPGSGIGLATVKRVISRHGGELWFEAKPDEGAVFFFTLPMHESFNQKLESEDK